MDDEPIEISTLRRLIEADFKIGKLFWLKRDLTFFSCSRSANTFNSRYAGKEALTAISDGYMHGNVLGKRYQAHRVIWALANNAWPTKEIDHTNGDRSDNRLENLRQVTRGENQHNLSMRSDNTSGVMGVSPMTTGRNKYWLARITTENGKINKCFEYSERGLRAAAEWRKEKEKIYGYHPNHGCR